MPLQQPGANAALRTRRASGTALRNISSESIRLERRQVCNIDPTFDKACDNTTGDGRQGHAKMPVTKSVD